MEDSFLEEALHEARLGLDEGGTPFAHMCTVTDINIVPPP